MAAGIAGFLLLQLRLPCATYPSVICRSLKTSTSTASSGQFYRSDFTNQPINNSYKPAQPPGTPPLCADQSGGPRITPKLLKEYLDQFVVGQERAKKVLSVAVFNHYQRIQDLKRQENELEDFLAQRDEVNQFQDDTSNWQDLDTSSNTFAKSIESHAMAPTRTVDSCPVTLEKSNILLLGPTGVGKTLMAKTLAGVLEVPFSISDCTPFTQAGYIGEDVEVCVSRLLVAANYDIERAERGIICLDEIDKIATARVSHGKDVGGEGVQQALLKIIDGTTVQVQPKIEKKSVRQIPRSGLGVGQDGLSRGPPSENAGLGGATNGNGDRGRGMSGLEAGIGPPSGKGEVYKIRTDNILFICMGAFVGLHKIILDRVVKGSIGFGANVQVSLSSASHGRGTMLEDDELFRKNVPFYIPESAPSDTTASNSQVHEEQKAKPKSDQMHNILDLVEPADLQKYGLIPELIGRLPINCSLSSLDEDALVRVLTEPRNSLLRQYEQLFHLSGIEIGFTSGALREVSKMAGVMESGARGLRTALERLLGDAMFETPGSSVKYIVVTEAVALLKQPPIYLLQDQRHRFHELISQNEEEWRRHDGDNTSHSDLVELSETEGNSRKADVGDNN